MTDRPTIAAIGAGHWGKNVVRTLHEMGALEAVAEPAPDTRATLAKRYPDVSLHADHRAVLDSDVPAVAIATPAPTHFEIARAALEAGKDVYVEKPITLSSKQAEDLVDLADREDRVLMVGHLLLYHPAIEWLQTHLADGKLGTVHTLHQRRCKLGRVRRVENVLWSFGVHDIAVLLHLAGQSPDQVQATGQCVLQADVEDDVHLHLTFPSGLRAHLHTSWLWPETSRSLTVVGSKGMLVYDELAQTITLHRRTVDEDLQAHDQGAEVVFEADGEPLRRELEHFRDRCVDRATPRSDGHQGVEVVRVLERAAASMEGRP